MWRNVNRFRRSIKAFNSMIFGQQSWRSFALPRSHRNYLQAVGDGTGSSTVMAPVQWICRTFPEAPLAVWHLDEDGGETIDRQHDLVKMLRRPNRFYSGKTMWMATLADFTVDGNAYWIKVKNRAGAVEELWWTPCGLLTPQGTPHEFISHYEYRPGGSSGSEAIVLDPSEVVHFRYGLDPEDIRKGHSPLKSTLR